MPTRPRIQHVSIPRPPGSGAQTRAFYGDVLGLEEIVVPQTIRDQDLIWFRLGDTELHLFTEAPLEDRSARHLCIEIDDLDGVRARLVAAGHVPIETTAIHGRPRFFCRDPFGNSLELATILEDYLAAEI